MQVGELFVALGFDVDDKQLKDFNQEVKNGMTGLLKMVGVMSGAAFAVNAFVSGAVRTSVELKNFREETGYASDDVERFYNVIGRLNSNVSFEQTIGAFRALSDTISQAKFGQGAIGQAGMLGLNDIGNMNPMDVINRLRENYSRNVGLYGADRTRDLMSELGLTSEFIQAIKATNQEFNTLFNKPILGGENRKRLEDIAEAQKELAFQWQLLRGELSADISDEMIVFMENLIPVMKDTASNIIAVSDALSKFFSTLSPEAVNSIKAMAVALFIALNPMVSLFIALALAINDFGKALRGLEDSVILKVYDRLAFLAKGLSQYSANMAGVGGDFSNPANGLIPAPTDFSRMSASGQLTVNNVWNIASNGDNLTLSDMIAQKEKRTLDAAISQQSRGVVQ